jgi:hypothetical protein
VDQEQRRKAIHGSLLARVLSLRAGSINLPDQRFRRQIGRGVIAGNPASTVLNMVWCIGMAVGLSLWRNSKLPTGDG